jgi:4-methylaminobutanoate oxidase (formaldehyde-forming)
VVVVGGGIAGCAVAYHLSALGAGRVVVLEQNRLAAGTTWHAAGAVGRMRTTATLARLNDRSAAMYARMEEETGLPTGWVETGSLTVARSAERMTQLRRAGAMASYYGVAVEEVGVDAIKEHWPLAETADLVGGVWLPNDGSVNPQLLVEAIAAGARQLGAEFHEGVRVTGFVRDRARVTAVETDRGRIDTERVVLCTGIWTPQLARTAGPRVPVQPVEHHYVLSAAVDPGLDNLPVVRDPDGCIYFRGRDSRIMLGAFQPVSKPWMVDRVPDDFAFELLEPDLDHLAPRLEEGLARLPQLRRLGIEQFVNGPEGFTPDGNALIGELPGTRGVYVCAGFNSSGLAYGGGVGEALAEWILAGEPPFDLWPLDVRRFSEEHSSTSFLRARGVEVLGTHMRMAYPNIEWERGRQLRRSPLYERLARRNACFGEKYGFERVNWFGRNGHAPRMSYSFGKPDWLESSREEHFAARERAALFDQSSFAKYTVEGRDALALLQRACGNDVDVEVGRVVYTAMLSAKGTFASDLTVLRRGDDRFLVVTGTAQRLADIEWLRARSRTGEQVEIADVSEDWAVLGLMGPLAREILGGLCSVDLSDEAFPFGTFQELMVAGVPCRALRITYVGEHGWEIQVPWARAPEDYDALRTSADPDVLADAGYYAINSLRLEKGYRQWGADIGFSDTPLEAGLSFAVAWDKPVPFHGRDALLRLREAGPPPKRLVSIVLVDPEAMLWGSEPMLIDGEMMGYTTSGAYGHSIGAAVGLGYIRRPGNEAITDEMLAAASLEVDIGDRLVPGRASLRAPLDPRRTQAVS